MIRSGYSFRTAFGKLPDVLSRLKEIGWTTAPIADRCSTFGFMRWTALAKEAGLRPVYGVELAVAPYLGEAVVDYWTFLARDDLGALHDLVYRATSNPGQVPALLYDDALAASGVVRIAGERVLLDRVSDPGKVYLSLSPATPRGLYLEAKRRGFAFVAGQSNYYPRPRDKETYRVAIGMRSSTHTYPCHIVDDDEWRASVVGSVDDKRSAIAARAEVLDGCRAEIKKATILVPEKTQTLRQMCQDGAARRGVDLTNPEYAARLDRELSVIAEKKFEDYFYLVADVIQYARTQMIVGPARGSSCGSLVCYLLEITDVDPLQWDLVFERFIDLTRKDLPDIDTDFSDDKRHLVFEYVERKYGKDHVAKLGTVAMFQSRSALNAIGVAVKVPPWMIEKVSASVITRSKGDSRADMTVTDTLTSTEAGREMMAQFPEAAIVGLIEDHPANAGQHAAGLVMTAGRVRDFVAVDARTGATMCDWIDAKGYNLIKIDVLGLTQLSIFERTLELIGKPIGWLRTVPLDDPAAYAVLNDRKFSGVFQMGPMQQNVTIEVVAEDMEDLVAMTALCRPGPIGSGATRAWIERRNGRQPATVDHPLLEPYLRKTFGVTVYQEQTLRIGREVGDLSWEEVTELRRAMSKSLGKEYFDRYGDPWKVGAIKKGMPAATADMIWNRMCSFGMYGFNRSHAVAYAMITYWTMYLKAHYPMEFAAATLDAEVDPIRQVGILRELSKVGIDYVPVDADRSVDRWVIDHGQGRLVGPLTSIKGIGPATMRRVLDCRVSGEPVPTAVRKKLERARTPIDSLYPITDALRAVCPDPRAIGIVSPIVSINEVQPGRRGEFDDVVILCQLMKLHPLDENGPGSVAKRGRRVAGPTSAINFFVRDDSGEIFCKLSRWDYHRLASILVDGKFPGRSLFAIKGNCPSNFRMLWVRNIKYVGEPPTETEEATVVRPAERRPQLQQTRQLQLDLA